jgi:hypothetical protein
MSLVASADGCVAFVSCKQRTSGWARSMNLSIAGSRDLREFTFHVATRNLFATGPLGIIPSRAASAASRRNFEAARFNAVGLASFTAVAEFDRAAVITARRR